MISDTTTSAAYLPEMLTAWLGTYLVHSTLLLLGAWAITQRLLRSPRRREIVWRAALCGGFLTASVQVGLGLNPALGRITVGQVPGGQATAPVVAEVFESPASYSSAGLALLESPPAAAAVVPDADPKASVDLRRVGPFALALGGLFALGSVLLGAGILSRRHRHQRRLIEGPLVRYMAQLQLKDPHLGKVALLACKHSDTPHATGFWRPRVVIPERALVELDGAEQRALLAHELAHLERRDPLWLALTRALQLLIPLQPLCALARRKLGACAEFLCDESAVERTGDRVALARSLTKVAGWIVAEDALPDAACAMASRRSLLGERVERILDEDAQRDVGTLIWRGAAVLALACTATAAPVIVAKVPSTPVDGLPIPSRAERGHLARELAAPAPATDMQSALGTLSDVLTYELESLAEELRGLRASAHRRVLPPATYGRIDEIEDSVRRVRAQVSRIEALRMVGASSGVEAPLVNEKPQR